MIIGDNWRSTVDDIAISSLGDRERILFRDYYYFFLFNCVTCGLRVGDVQVRKMVLRNLWEMKILMELFSVKSIVMYKALYDFMNIQKNTEKFAIGETISSL